MLTTNYQKNHEEVILSLLCAAHGEWVSGRTLTYDSKTTNLSARLLGLKAQGYLIESETQEGSDFKRYRLKGRGTPPPPRRSQLVVKLPSSLTEVEVEELEMEIKKLVHEFSDKTYNQSLFLSLFEGDEE